MAKTFSILYVTSEIYPFSKTNALADVAYSLPLAVRELGHDIRVMLPKYGHISERKNRIHEINRLKDMPISIGGTTDLATVKSSSIASPRTKVQAYITTNISFLDKRKGIYTDIKSGKEFSNNDERFIFFNKTVIETCLLLGWSPDIIHINNWHTAMIAAFAKILFPSKFKKTKIVLTIHDFMSQGVFPESTFDKIGMPAELKDNFIHNGKFNFLKGAISYADAINTVSPTYAQEILQDSEYGDGLNQVLLDRPDKLTGITHAVDPWAWMPKNDNEIKEKYIGNFPFFKQQNRTDLLKEMGWEDDATSPIIAVMAYFDTQSGMDLLAESTELLLKENVRIIVMGEGDHDIIMMLKKIARKYHDRFVLKIGFDETLSHKIIAGSDMILLPSKREPSAMNAIIGLSYGTLPIGRATGANIDIIRDYEEENPKSNGFLFSDYNSEALVSSVKKAKNIFENKAQWFALGASAMGCDYTWESSAKKYDEIYRNLMRD